MDLQLPDQVTSDERKYFITIVDINIWVKDRFRTQLKRIFLFDRTCSWISNNLQWDVDEHVYLTYQNSASGIVGMAWVGSTCSIYQYYRSNINEWFRTDTITAQVT